MTVRPAAAGAVLGLAIAVGAPTAWQLSRPSEAAGAPVEQVITAPSAPPSSAAATSAGPDRFPSLGAQDAAPTVVPDPPPPVRLGAPSLGIDAAVDEVGVSPDGQMELPEDVSRVGWYRFGPLPGEDGSAVLAGHVDDREQGLGALARLREAAVGHEIRVTDAEGATTAWRVVSRELITKQALPLDELFGRDGPPRLVVITCGGPFLPEYRSYRDNVVVVAEPVAAPPR